MNVTEEEYLKYYRPWWQMKKKEQRNREAMEQNGYTEESYEEWKENDMRTELFSESMGDYYSSSSAASSGGGGGWFGGNYGMYGQSGAGGSGYVDGVAPFTHNGKYYPAETEAGVNEGNGRAFIRYVECA